MQTLAALISAAPDTALATGGFVIGVLLGGVLSTTNYCMMGAVSDWYTSGHKGRLGAVALAAATAIIGTQALDFEGVTDLSKSIYLMPRINWAGAIGGGLIFGYGMVYAGGCPSRVLVRAGAGDVRGLMTMVVLAIAAYATISGILGSFRVALDSSTALDLKQFGAPTQSFAAILGFAGLTASASKLIAAALVALPLLFFAIGPARILTQPKNLFAGLGVGGLAVAGWALTGMAVDEFAASPLQPASLSFVRPVADAIDWIERSTALGLPGFGAASVFGVLVGALLTSGLSGRLKFTGFADASDLKRHIFGAAAMGVGGVLALGCTIGQGVSGISTLSVQSLIAVAAILAGAALGLYRLERSIG